jgi:hypothetical protein
MGKGEFQADAPANRMADDMGGGGIEVVKQGGKVGGNLFDGKELIGAGATAEPPGIERDDTMIGFEVFHGMGLPYIERKSSPREKDHGRARAHVLIINIHSGH